VAAVNNATTAVVAMNTTMIPTRAVIMNVASWLLVQTSCSRGPSQQATSARDLTGLLVADAEARASSEHAGGDVHGEKLLEEELSGIGDVNLRDACLVVAGTALVFALLELTVSY